MEAYSDNKEEGGILDSADQNSSIIAFFLLCSWWILATGFPEADNYTEKQREEGEIKHATQNQINE